MSKYNEQTLKGIYKRVVGSMSGLMDINVEIDPQVVPHWDPDKKTIRMPSVISYARSDDEDFTIGRGIVVHESGHVLFCPPFSSDGDQDYGEWFNVFIDCNNEFKVTELWPHLKAPLANKTQTLVKYKPKILESDNPFIQVLMRCDKLCGLEPKFPAEYPEYLTKFVERTVTDFHKKEIHAAKGEKVIKFTKMINKRWQKLKEEKDPQGTLAKKLRGDKIHKLMKELGDLIRHKGDQQAIKDVQDKIKTEGELNKWFKDEIDRRIVSKIEGQMSKNYNDMTIEELKEMLEKARKENAKNNTETNSWGCEDLTKANSVKKIEPYESEYNDETNLFDVAEAHKTGKLVNKALKRKVELQSAFNKRHRSGTIDLEEIRRQVGQMGRVYKETVFMRDTDFSRGGNWAVEILVDCSGSMGRRKMINAKQAMATLAYAFDGLPNVKYAITGFNYEEDTVMDIQVKKFSDRRLDVNKLQLLHSRGGNADGYNIRSACKRLNKFRNMKKVLIVISDGQPAYENGIEDTKRAVKLCSRYKINTIGIGIEGCTEKTLQYIYPTSYFFEQSETLHKDLTNLILSCLGSKEKIKLVKDRWSR